MTKREKAVHAAAARALGLPKTRIGVAEMTGRSGFDVFVYAPLGGIDSERVHVLCCDLQRKAWAWAVWQCWTERGTNYGHPVVESKPRPSVP